MAPLGSGRKSVSGEKWWRGLNPPVCEEVATNAVAFIVASPVEKHTLNIKSHRTEI